MLSSHQLWRSDYFSLLGTSKLTSATPCVVLGLPGYRRSQEMRSHPAKGLLRRLRGCCTWHTGAVGRPGFAHPGKKRLRELTVVVHNLIGTAEKVRPDFSEVHSERTKKVTRCRKGHCDWIQGKRSPQGGWLSTGSREAVESPPSQICRAQWRKALQISSSPSRRLD